MDDTEVAVIGYLPGPRPGLANIACFGGRTPIPVEKIPTGRARKRRTVPADQPTLALKGRIDEVHGYSFVLTNPPVDTAEELAEAEWWYRHRTDIEILDKDAKHGAGLVHLPSASHAVNSVWMWGALLGCAIAAWIQELAGIDAGNGRGRRTVARLARELITVPARITYRAGTMVLRLPLGLQLLTTVLPVLQRLPRPDGITIPAPAPAPTIQDPERRCRSLRPTARELAPRPAPTGAGLPGPGPLHGSAPPPMTTRGSGSECRRGSAG